MADTKEVVQDDVLEVPVTNLPTGEELPKTDETILNLDDVGYMVMVGRKKDGSTFFRTANVNDLVMILGLLDYGVEEVKAELAKHRG